MKTCHEHLAVKFTQQEWFNCIPRLLLLFIYTFPDDPVIWNGKASMCYSSPHRPSIISLAARCLRWSKSQVGLAVLSTGNFLKLPITPNEQPEPFQCQVYSLPVRSSANRLVSLHSHLVDPSIRLPWKLNPCIYQQFPDLLVTIWFLTLLDSLLQIQLVLCLTKPTIALWAVFSTLPCSHDRCCLSCCGVSSKTLARWVHLHSPLTS